MKIEDVSKKYNIPVSVLKEYSEWGLCSEVCNVMGKWRCDEVDLERLSMIMTLHGIGFTNEQVHKYMSLYLSEQNTDAERMKMLNEMRGLALDEIHFREKQLESLDYLRHQIKNK